MNKVRLIFAILLPLLMSSCSSAKKVKVPQQKTINIILECNASTDTRYNGLSHGIDIFVSSDVSERTIIDASECTYEIRQIVSNSIITVDPTIKQFIRESVGLFAKSSGIKVGANTTSDYSMRINVRKFNVILGNQSSDRGVVELEYSLSNTDNEILMHQTVRGRYVASDNRTSYSYILDRALTEAIKGINWDEMAGYLKTPDRAEQQPLTQVKGNGETALENTIIRWNIESRPAGADIYWRVVSSTPDVKNTNSNYLGTTPYESTESFDIKGLSYQNSGNIQIEIKCEKNGYIPQTRRFNLRQAIDQKEISTKFNLVKDEE